MKSPKTGRHASIVSIPTSKEYKVGWERIFSKKHPCCSFDKVCDGECSAHKDAVDKQYRMCVCENCLKDVAGK